MDYMDRELSLQSIIKSQQSTIDHLTAQSSHILAPVKLKYEHLLSSKDIEIKNLLDELTEGRREWEEGRRMWEEERKEMEEVLERGVKGAERSLAWIYIHTL